MVEESSNDEEMEVVQLAFGEEFVAAALVVGRSFVFLWVMILSVLVSFARAKSHRTQVVLLDVAVSMEG